MLDLHFEKDDVESGNWVWWQSASTELFFF